MAQALQSFLDHLQMSTVVLAVVAAAGAVIAFIGLTSVRRISLSEEAARVSGVHEMSPFDKLQARLDQSGVQVRLLDLITVGVIIGMIACVVFGLLGLLTLGLLCIPAGPVAYYLYLMSRRNRTLRAFREALPDAIDDCADCLATNPALASLIERMKTMAPPAIRPTFERVSELALPIEGSLPSALRTVANSRDEVFFRQFLFVLADYGDSGNPYVRSALARVSHGQRALLRLQDRVAASQAGARIVAYVYAIAPVAFLVFMRLFGGDAYRQFYQLPLGQLTQVCVLLSGLLTYWLALRVANRGLYVDEIDSFRSVADAVLEVMPAQASASTR
jgi:Flp pilus assembly protein TadB